MGRNPKTSWQTLRRKNIKKKKGFCPLVIIIHFKNGIPLGASNILSPNFKRITLAPSN